jgi:signal transduction histidine kinase
LRLQTSGVERVLALVHGPPAEVVVVFFENPNAPLASGFVDSDISSAIARMAASARSTYESVARVLELRAIAAWLPVLEKLSDGEIEEGEALRDYAELVAAPTILALRRDRENIDASWAAMQEQVWQLGSTRLRNGAALKLDALDAEQLNTLAKLLGVPPAPTWAVGRAAGGTIIALGQLIDGNESLDALASLLDAAAERGRDTTAARNNAMLTERARIAGVIHEGITQVLTNVAIQMEVLDQVMEDPAAARKMVVAMRNAVLEALDSLRGAILELTPNAPEWTDLGGGLERFVGDFGAQWGLELDYRVEGTAREVDPDVLALAFSVVQEALSNVRKHSGTTEAEVVLTFTEDTIAVSISDRGKGFDPRGGPEEGFRLHQGLQIVRSRVRLAGGRLHVESAPGEGTTMTVEVAA